MGKNKIYNAREQAVRSLVHIEREGAFSNLETREVLSRFDFNKADQGLYLTLVYGTLQNKRWIDSMLSKVVKQPLNQLNETVLMILRTAVYQMIFLDRVPDYAVVDEAVNMAGRLKKQAKGFINGVLRNFLRQKEILTAFDLSEWENEKEGLALRYSIPQRIVFQYCEAFGEEKAMQIIPTLNQDPPFSIRVNTLKTSREDLMAALSGAGFEVTPGKCDPACIHLCKTTGVNLREEPRYNAGEYTVQDQGAMMLTALLDPQPGDCICDMCAAPGGKTTHLAQLMNNQGEIFARDVHESRVALIDQTAKRLGIDIIRTEVADGTVLDPIDIGYFDRILCDAPCSGTGIIRRKPEIRDRNGRKERRALRQTQAALLNNAAKMLKPGGVLVYSTCTVDAEENEKQIEKLLAAHPELQIVDGTMGYTDPTLDGSDVFFHCKLIKAD